MRLCTVSACLTARCISLRVGYKSRRFRQNGNAGRTTTYGPRSSSHDEGYTPRSDECDSNRDSESAHGGHPRLVLVPSFAKISVGDLCSRLR